MKKTILAWVTTLVATCLFALSASAAPRVSVSSPQVDISFRHGDWLWVGQVSGMVDWHLPLTNGRSVRLGLGAKSYTDYGTDLDTPPAVYDVDISADWVFPIGARQRVALVIGPHAEFRGRSQLMPNDTRHISIGTNVGAMVDLRITKRLSLMAQAFVWPRITRMYVSNVSGTTVSEWSFDYMGGLEAALEYDITSDVGLMFGYHYQAYDMFTHYVGLSF